MFRDLRPLMLFVLPFALLFSTACQPISPEYFASEADSPSQNAAATVDYPLAYAAPNCDYGGAIRSLEALDARTVRITLCQADSNLPYKMSFGQLSINDSGYLQATGGGGDQLLFSPNGTGPYKLVDWSDDYLITFERNDDYWGDSALVKNLVISSSDDASASLAALQAGEIDAVRTVPVDLIEEALADDTLQLVELPPLNVEYLGVNNMIPPFDNERVRQAVAMAIDREALVAEFYPPGSLVPSETLPPQVVGHSAAAEWYPYDPEQARAILAEEGVENLEVDLAYAWGGISEDVAEALAEQLADIGIVATPKDDGQFEDYFGQLMNGEVGAFDYIGWLGGPDAIDWYVLFARDAGYEFGEGWEDIWDEIELAAAAPTQEEKQVHYDRLAQLIKQHVPLIPFVHIASSSALRADVAGYEPNFDVARTPFSAVQVPDGDSFHYQMDIFPHSAYCADTIEVGSDVICRQVLETLTTLDPVTLLPAPGLATEWRVDDEMKEWTFTLRDGVRFHNGAQFDADDVINSFAVMWDAANPLHVGDSGAFDAWSWTFGAMLNEAE